MDLSLSLGATHQWELTWQLFIGDLFLSSAFLSYGCLFDQQHRNFLLTTWPHLLDCKYLQGRPCKTVFLTLNPGPWREIRLVDSRRINILSSLRGSIGTYHTLVVRLRRSSWTNLRMENHIRFAWNLLGICSQIWHCISSGRCQDLWSYSLYCP